MILLAYLFFSVNKYRSSTFFLAQGVRLKNFKLDFMLGSILKTVNMQLVLPVDPILID